MNTGTPAPPAAAGGPAEPLRLADVLAPLPVGGEHVAVELRQTAALLGELRRLVRLERVRHHGRRDHLDARLLRRLAHSLHVAGRVATLLVDLVPWQPLRRQ